MIARIWRGITHPVHSDEYLKYLEETGLKDYRNIEGNRGVFVFRKNENGKCEFLLISLWDSFESIRKFAGEDIDKAVYYPDDKNYLLALEPKVIHYEVKHVSNLNVFNFAVR